MTIGNIIREASGRKYIVTYDEIQRMEGSKPFSVNLDRDWYAGFNHSFVSDIFKRPPGPGLMEHLDPSNQIAYTFSPPPTDVWVDAATKIVNRYLIERVFKPKTGCKVFLGTDGKTHNMK